VDQHRESGKRAVAWRTGDALRREAPIVSGPQGEDCFDQSLPAFTHRRVDGISFDFGCNWFCHFVCSLSALPIWDKQSKPTSVTSARYSQESDLSPDRFVLRSPANAPSAVGGTTNQKLSS
jgi:hypothetical protein